MYSICSAQITVSEDDWRPYGTERIYNARADTFAELRSLRARSQVDIMALVQYTLHAGGGPVWKAVAGVGELGEGILRSGDSIDVSASVKRFISARYYHIR